MYINLIHHANDLHLLKELYIVAESLNICKTGRLNTSKISSLQSGYCSLMGFNICKRTTDIQFIAWNGGTVEKENFDNYVALYIFLK